MAIYSVEYYKYFFKKKKALGKRWMDLEGKIVDEINRKTRFY